MAKRYWTGRAASTTQVTKVVFSLVTIGATYSVTINGKSVSYTAATAVLGDLIDALVAAWSSSAEPEHQEMTAARREDPTLSGLQLTGNTAGVPYTVTASATSGTATVTTPTTASGPNFWNVAANWDGSTLPTTADDLILRDTDVSVLYGLTDTTNYASISIEASYTGAVGLPDTNALGYPEYRSTFLTLGTGSAITVNLGYGDGSYASLIRLNTNASNTTLTVFGATSNTSSSYPIELKNPGTGSTARIYGGGVKFDATTSGVLATLDVIERSNSGATPVVRCTDLVTVTTATCYGGRVLLEATVSTLVARENAIVTIAKAAAAATVKTSSNAIVYWESSGNITTKLHVEANGTIDFSRVGTTKTVAACDLYRSGVLLDPIDKVTFTTGVVLMACRLADVTLDLGVGVTING
jgi:hypothetical protein